MLSAFLIGTVSLSATWGYFPSFSLTKLPRHSLPKQADNLPESEYQQEFQVSPQDPGYLAIKYLIKHYNCMSLYADGHTGSRVELIRSEAVVDLNSCLDRAQNLIQTKMIQLASQKQVDAIQLRLQSLSETIKLLKRKNNVEN